MDSNDKILLSGSNVSLVRRINAPRLRGIPNDFAVRCLRNLLIVAPFYFPVLLFYYCSSRRNHYRPDENSFCIKLSGS